MNPTISSKMWLQSLKTRPYKFPFIVQLAPSLRFESKRVTIIVFWPTWPQLTSGRGGIINHLTLSRTGGVFPSTARGGVNLTHTCLTASEGPAKHILCNIIYILTKLGTTCFSALLLRLVKIWDYCQLQRTSQFLTLSSDLISNLFDCASYK